MDKLEVGKAYVAVEPDFTALRDGLMAAARAIDGMRPPDGRDGTEATACGGNLVHVSREDWDDISGAMDKLRAERDRLAEGLRCMTVERDFWREEVKRLRELVDSLSKERAASEQQGAWSYPTITYAGKEIPLCKTEVSMDEGMA